MFALITSLRRRWQWLDKTFRGLETYTSLNDQYPYLKPALKLLGAALLAVWTYLGESWLPLAIVVGLGAYTAFSLFPLTLPQASASEGNATDRIIHLSTRIEDFARTVAQGHDLLDKKVDHWITRIDDLTQRITKIEDAVSAEGGGLLGNLRASKSRFDDIEASIESAKNGFSHSISQLRQVIDANAREMRDNVVILSRAIRVRDAEEMLNERDAIVMDLGKKLLAADPTIYSDNSAWDTDYERWKLALGQIDDIVFGWAPHRDRCLDIRADHYETSTASPPPGSNLTGDRSLFRYKTVARGQDNYAGQRAAMFNFFYSKKEEVPG